MGGESQLVMLMMVAITAACPVIDNRCFCRYVEKSRSVRLQFVTCSNMGLLQQVPAFAVSYGQTEQLLVTKNTTIIRLHLLTSKRGI